MIRSEYRAWTWAMFLRATPCTSITKTNNQISFRDQNNSSSSDVILTIHYNRLKSIVSGDNICHDNSKYIDLCLYRMHFDLNRSLYSMDKHNQVHNLWNNLTSQWMLVCDFDMWQDMMWHIPYKLGRYYMLLDNDLFVSNWHWCNCLHNHVPWLRMQNKWLVAERLNHISLLHNDLVCTLRRYWYHWEQVHRLWTNHMDQAMVDKRSQQQRLILV